MSGRAFIHVGSPKTGTTFLQAVLWRNRPQLRAAGLLLPGPNLHKHFQAALEVRGTPGRARFPDQIDGAWHRLVEAARGWPGDVLISHELLSSAPPERAVEAVDELAAEGFEPHVVLTARDLARQLPAEWQERLKHRSFIEFERFMTEARDPESGVSRTLWAAQDYGDILARWAPTLPREQVHVVTVPRPGAPKTLLWERFAGVLDIDPSIASLDVPRDNTSLGFQQAVLLREVNQRLGDRVPMPGSYTDVGKMLLAQRVLASRAGSPLALGGEDLDFARSRSKEVVDRLRARLVTVHGDLDELLVPEDRDAPAISTAREALPPGVLLEESLGSLADLLAAVADRSELDQVQRSQLREQLQEARTELRAARRRIGELERPPVPLPVRARRALGARTRRLAGRVRPGRRRPV